MKQYYAGPVNVWTLITLQYYAGPVNGGALHCTGWALTNYSFTHLFIDTHKAAEKIQKQQKQYKTI